MTRAAPRTRRAAWVERPRLLSVASLPPRPAWSGAGAGDEVYAPHVNRYGVFAMSRMRVIDTERRDCCGTAPVTWQRPVHSGHGDWSTLGAGGFDAMAVHVDAAPVRGHSGEPGCRRKRFSGTPNLPRAFRIFRCVGAR
ncbi:hypothetical protein GCM10010433_74780 [Streptomyces pulveraceus]